MLTTEYKKAVRERCEKLAYASSTDALLADDCEKLLAEVERLEVALREIATHPSSNLGKISEADPARQVHAESYRMGLGAGCRAAAAIARKALREE